jgi:esterase/lipase superfamily enzyme
MDRKRKSRAIRLFGWHQGARLLGKVFAALALGVLLPGCASRGAITVDPAAAETGSVVEILVASTRSSPSPETFATRGRSDTIQWGKFDVSVPPDRRPGTVQFPSGAETDPETDFLTVASGSFADDRAFLTALNAKLAARPPGQREVTLFVHGFNVNLAEGVYRHAQMAHDFQSPGVSVSYSWPSAARLFAYGYDLESALFAREGLERVLGLLARSDAEDVVLVGHSMGSVVVMETVRQIAIRGTDDVLDRIQAVILIAPDLDPELFRAEVLAMAPRELPIYVTVSGRDRALKVSGLLRGQSERLGSIGEASSVAALPGVVVIDVSDIQGTDDPLNHFAVATSPAMIAFMTGLDRLGSTIMRDAARSSVVFDATVEAVAGVTEVQLLPRITQGGQ